MLVLLRLGITQISDVVVVMRSSQCLALAFRCMYISALFLCVYCICCESSARENCPRITMCSFLGPEINNA